MREYFAGVGNEALALLTVVLNGTRDLGEVEAIKKAAVQATRYRIGQSRKSSSRWESFAGKFYIEVDAVGAEHIPLLLPERLALLHGLAPISRTQNGATWVPTFHAIVHIGALDHGEVQAAFAKTWGASRQVHVRPFDVEQPVEVNLDATVAYACKNLCAIDLPNTRGGTIRDPWPMSWQVEYHTWLHQFRNGFEFMRFSIPPNVVQNLVQDGSVCFRKVDVDPLPMLF